MWAILRAAFACEVLSEDIKITVLVDCERVIEPDVIVNQLLALVDFAMYKRAVHVMVDV